MYNHESRVTTNMNQLHKETDNEIQQHRTRVRNDMRRISVTKCCVSYPVFHDIN